MRRALVYVAVSLAGATWVVLQVSHRRLERREIEAAAAAREDPKGRVPGFRRLTGITALARLPGDRLAVGDATGRVFVRDLRAPSGATPAWWAAHDAAVRRLWPLGDDGLATASADGSVGRWGLDGSPRSRMRLPEAHLNDAVPHAGESTVYVVADRGTVARLCDPEPCWKHLGVHGAAAYAVTFSPDGTRLATAGMDGHVALRDPLTGERTAMWRVSPKWVTALAWTPDGLFAGDNGGRIIFIPSGDPEGTPATLPPTAAPVVILRAAPELAPGGQLLAGSEDGRLSVVALGEPDAAGARAPVIRAQAETGAAVRAIVVDADVIYTGGADGVVRRFTLSSDGRALVGQGPLEILPEGAAGGVGGGL